MIRWWKIIYTIIIIIVIIIDLCFCNKKIYQYIFIIFIRNTDITAASSAQRHGLTDGQKKNHTATPINKSRRLRARLLINHSLTRTTKILVTLLSTQLQLTVKKQTHHHRYYFFDAIYYRCHSRYISIHTRSSDLVNHKLYALYWSYFSLGGNVV